MAVEVAEFLAVCGEMNLSGRRGCEAGQGAVTLSARNANGDVAGVVVVSAEGEELTIRDWVVQRGEELEFGLMDRVVEEAAARGCTRVRGEFRANGRNEELREFLAQFGFTMIGADDAGTLWILPVSAYEPMG